MKRVFHAVLVALMLVPTRIVAQEFYAECTVEVFCEFGKVCEDGPAAEAFMFSVSFHFDELIARLTFPDAVESEELNLINREVFKSVSYETFAGGVENPLLLTLEIDRRAKEITGFLISVHDFFTAATFNGVCEAN